MFNDIVKSSCESTVVGYAITLSHSYFVCVSSNQEEVGCVHVHAYGFLLFSFY